MSQRNHMCSLNIASDFAGFAGQLNPSWGEIPTASIISFNSYFTSPHCRPIEPFVPFTPSWSIQILKDSSTGCKMRGDIVCLLEDSNNKIVTWAGSVWEVPKVDGYDEKRSLSYLLVSPIYDHDFENVKRIDGDYAAAISSGNKVVLFRSLISLTNLFYKIEGNKIQWSTNFMDLIDDPLNFDRDKLITLAYGEQSIPYKGIDLLEQGEYLCFEQNYIKRGFFDQYENVSYNCNYTLRDWGEDTREVMKQAVKKKARRFKKVGLLLSGGIDSSGVLRSLVDCGINVMCYNWSCSSYPPADEEIFATKTTDFLKLSLKTFDISNDRLPGGKMLDDTWEFIAPHNHLMYTWWKNSILLIKDEVDCIMTGINGEVFSEKSESNAVLLNLIQMGFPRATQFLLHAFSTDLSTRTILKNLLPRLNVSRTVNRIQPMIGYSVDTLDYAELHSLLPPRRQAYHFSDDALRRAVQYYVKPHTLPFLLHLSLNMNLIQPAGLVHLAPYLDRNVQNLARSIPDLYKEVSYGGHRFSKPVLRQAFLDLLPPEIIRRNYREHYEGLFQQYCRNNKAFIMDILSDDSYLAQYNIVEPNRLHTIFEDNRKLDSSAITILTNCFIEFWLKNLNKKKYP